MIGSVLTIISLCFSITAIATMLADVSELARMKHATTQRFTAIRNARMRDKERGFWAQTFGPICRLTSGRWNA